MSSVDNRVVRMQFDNAQFEQGVAKSMKTLDMLNEKLQFKEASKGLSALMVTIDGVSSKSVSTAVKALDRVSSYTTTVLGMMAKQVKEQFADKIVQAIESIPAKAMSQIKSGGWNRAMNIANAQFQIEGLKFSWEEVRKAADYAVTDTAYGLDAAAKAASQLAASGVDFAKVIGTDEAGKEVTQMHRSLRAISGVAAMTNSSYEDISHIFTTIAGQGKVMGEQLNQLAGRGLNAAATLATALGTTEAEVREMVSRGKIDFATFSEAMDEAYGEHAKEANKTFTGALSNMKAALSRIGAIFTQPVIDKTNTFFVSVTDRIKEFQKALNDTTGYKLTEKGLESIRKKAKQAADARADLTNANARESFVEQEVERLKTLALGEELKKSLDTGDVESFSIIRFAGHFAEAWESAVKAASAIVTSLDLTWFQDIADFLDKIAIKAKTFFDGITDFFNESKEKVEEASETLNTVTGITLRDFEIIKKVMSGSLGTMETRWNAIDELMGKEGEGKRIQGYIDQLAAVEYSYEAVGWTEDWIKQKEKEATEAVEGHTEGIAAEVAATKEVIIENRKRLTDEEVLYQNIAYTIENTKRAVGGVKTTIGNVVKIVASFGKSISRIIGDIAAIGESFQPYMITEGFALISEKVLYFVESIELSHEKLYGFYDLMANVGSGLGALVDEFVTAAAEAFEFAAACMGAEESLEELADSGKLTPLQLAVISVLRVLKNLWKTVTNIARAIASVVKPIVKAFRNVFNPSGIAAGVADFSEGIANLSEKLILSEDVAKAVEVVFTGLFAAVQKLVEIFARITGGVAKFVTSFGKTKKPLSDTKDSIDSVEKSGEKAQGIFDSLRIIFEKFIAKIKELPSKFEELKKEIEEQEGVQRLKKNFTDLWGNIKKGLSSSIDPLRKGLQEVAEATGGSGTTAIGVFADGVGKVAGKISDFIEKIPEYQQRFEGFFDNIKKKIDDTISRLHITGLFDSIGNAFDITAQTEGSIINKIKAFAGSIYDKVAEVVESVDWKKVSKAGLLGLIFANLVEFLGITSNIKTLIANIAAVPKTLGGIFKSLSGLLNQGTASLKKFTDIYAFVAVTQMVSTLIAAVILLADMDEERLKTGLAAFTWIGIIVAIIARYARGKGDVTKIKDVKKNVDNSTKGIINVNQSIGGPLGFAAAIGAFAGAVWLIAKAASELVTVVDNADDASVGNMIKTIGAIVISLVIVATLIVAAAKGMKFGKNEVKVFSGLGVALAGFGVAVWLIAKAAESLSGVNIETNALLTIFGIISALVIFTYVLGHAAKGVNIKSVIGIGAVLAILGGVVFVIIGELLLLSLVMSKMADKGQGDVIIAALGVIVGLILAMGVFAYLLGNGAKGLEKVKGVGAIVLAIGGAIFLACLGFKSIAKTMSEINDPAVVIEAAVVLIIALALIGATVVGVLKELQAHRGYLEDDASKSLFAIALIFVSIGAAMWLIGEAVKSMGEAINATYDPDDKNKGDPVLAVFGFIGAILTVLALLIAALSSSKMDPDKITEPLVAISLAFLAIGVSVLAIAKAAEMLAGLQDPSAFWKIVGLIAGIFVALGVLAALAGGTKVGDGLDKLATFCLSFAVSLLVMGAAVLLLGAGLGALGAGLGVLAEGIAKLAETFSEHWLTAILVIVGIGVFIFLLYKLSKVMEQVAITIVEILGNVLAVAKDLIAGFKKLITGSRDKLKTFWKGASSKMKLAVTGTLVAISGAILAATPEMLDNLKKMIKKIIYFIIDIIPTLVDAIFDILLRIINALADTIRKNSSEIAYAFWNAVEALLEVIIDVVAQGVNLLITSVIGPIAKLLGKDFDASKWTEGMKQGFSQVKAKMREGMAANLDYKNSTEILTEAYSGLDTSMNKLADDYATQNGLVKDANGFYVKASESADKASNSFINVAQAVEHAKSQKPFNVSDLVSGAINGDAITDGLEKLGVGGGESFLGGLGNVLGGDGVSIPGMDDMSFDNLMDNSGFDMDTLMNTGDEDGIYYESAFADSIDSPNSREEVSTATDNLMGEVEDTIDSHKDELTGTTIPKVMHEVYNSMVANSGETNKAAKFIVDGINRVIANNLGNVESAGEDMAYAIDEGFVGPLMIRSPSRKFYQNGLYILMGLKDGIKQNETLATNAMTTLSDQMINSFGNPLEYAAKIASGEIQYDPTIRPVVDSSNIGRTALDVDSMFRNQSISLSGLSGQIAYDMTNLNGSNAAVVAEIQALREDMDYMTDELTNMQIVMDTGALVGSTVGAYDQALGRRANWKGRGN